MTAKPVPAADLVLLRHHLTILRLPTVKAECEQVARQCASENIDYLGFLLRLCERELSDREQRACARRLKAARFPQVKSLDTFDFTAQNHYTFIHMGFARTGQTPAREVRVIPDNGADPGALNVGFRVIHAGAGLGNVDVNLIRHRADTLTLPVTPLVANVAYGAASAYVTLAADAVAADSLRVVVTAAGTTTPILANVALPTGQAGTTSVNPIPGARVAGSVMTAVVVPRSVAGSAAPQTAAFTTPSAVILVDRRPPDTVP